MSTWGNPEDYECWVLFDPGKNLWKTVAARQLSLSERVSKNLTVH